MPTKNTDSANTDFKNACSRSSLAARILMPASASPRCLRPSRGVYGFEGFGCLRGLGFWVSFGFWGSVLGLGLGFCRIRGLQGLAFRVEGFRF